MPTLPFLDAALISSPVRDLGDVLDHEVPPLRGAYVLLADPHFTFPYPSWRSAVFYIGQSSNLRRRLLTHARFIKEARSDRRRTLYPPMYEYGASFGARYALLRTRGVQAPRNLEEHLLAMFAEHYLSWPVANGIGGWASLRSLRQLVSDRRGA